MGLLKNGDQGNHSQSVPPQQFVLQQAAPGGGPTLTVSGGANQFGALPPPPPGPPPPQGQQPMVLVSGGGPGQGYSPTHFNPQAGGGLHQLHHPGAGGGGSTHSYSGTSSYYTTSGTSYYSHSQSPYGSGSGVHYGHSAVTGPGAFGPMGGSLLGPGAGGLYGVTTEGPPPGMMMMGPKLKKKKKKKKAKAPTMTKEEQEEERQRQQAELEAAEKPDLGSAVDENQTYLKDPGPKQIIINYLPLDLGEDELVAIFEQFGPVEAARFVSDKNSGKSKGYGFVYYYYSKHAENAIKSMNGFELYDKILKVSYAVPQRPRPAEGGKMTIPGEEEEEGDGSVAKPSYAGDARRAVAPVANGADNNNNGAASGQQTADASADDSDSGSEDEP